jgi:hypothetical protein
MTETERPTVGVRTLTARGKPMRALRALAGSDAGNPLTEYDVYRASQAPGDWKQEAFHDALRTLVARGLATRCPAAHGRTQWFITDAGREALR